MYKQTDTALQLYRYNIIRHKQLIFELGLGDSSDSVTIVIDSDS